MSNNILSVSSITKSFGGLEAVNVENFQIKSNLYNFLRDYSLKLFNNILLIPRYLF